MLRYRRYIYVTVVLLSLVPVRLWAQYDYSSTEAYINDHKVQRTVLLARSALETSNTLLHEALCTQVTDYKQINSQIDKWTRAFDVVNLLVDALSVGLNIGTTCSTVNDRLGDYKNLLEDYYNTIVARGRMTVSDSMIIVIGNNTIERLKSDCSDLYTSFIDLIAYTTGVAACSTSELILIIDSLNDSLDNIRIHINQSYLEMWKYVQLRLGYHKESVQRALTKKEIADSALLRWRRVSYVN